MRVELRRRRRRSRPSPPRGGLDGARLVLLETPSNPQLDVCDIAAVARAAARGRRGRGRRQHDGDAARASGRWSWAPT